MRGHTKAHSYETLNIILTKLRFNYLRGRPQEVATNEGWNWSKKVKSSSHIVAINR